MDKYVVAFIDLLGSRKKIETDKDGAYFKTICKLYNLVLSLIPSIDDQEIKSKIFSDNVVFARKITDDNENKIANLHQMTSLVAAFQLMAIIQANTLLKGGITFGEFYIDENMVWGKGLIEAYDLESDKSHILPTIVLGGEARSVALSNPERLIAVSELADGELFVDYMQLNDKNSKNNALLGFHRFAVLKIFNDIKINAEISGKPMNNSIQAKMSFIGGYHNHWCEKMALTSLCIDEDNWLSQYKDANMKFVASGIKNFTFQFGIPQGRND